MTPEQEAHLQHIKDNFCKEVDEKYRAGQKEHGGNLFELPIIDLIREAKKEAVDQYTYLDSAEAELIRTKTLLMALIGGVDNSVA